MSFDTVHTTETSVVCDGDGGAMSHPRVYLHMEGGKVVCPYCSRLFLLSNTQEDDGVIQRAIAENPGDRALGAPGTALDLENAH